MPTAAMTSHELAQGVGNSCQHFVMKLAQLILTNLPARRRLCTIREHQYSGATKLSTDNEIALLLNRNLPRVCDEPRPRQRVRQPDHVSCGSSFSPAGPLALKQVAERWCLGSGKSHYLHDPNAHVQEDRQFRERGRDGGVIRINCRRRRFARDVANAALTELVWSCALASSSWIQAGTYSSAVHSRALSPTGRPRAGEGGPQRPYLGGGRARMAAH